jgi:hypothetical protein
MDPRIYKNKLRMHLCTIITWHAFISMCLSRTTYPILQKNMIKSFKSRIYILLPSFCNQIQGVVQVENLCYNINSYTQQQTLMVCVLMSFT